MRHSTLTQNRKWSIRNVCKLDSTWLCPNPCICTSNIELLYVVCPLSRFEREWLGMWCHSWRQHTTTFVTIVHAIALTAFDTIQTSQKQNRYDFTSIDAKTSILFLVVQNICGDSFNLLPITVAAWSKAWTVFVRPNAGIVGSDPTWSMDVCVRLFCFCIVLCVGSGLGRPDPPSKESYRLCIY
jgi:hypothetical protein